MTRWLRALGVAALLSACGSVTTPPTGTAIAPTLPAATPATTAAPTQVDRTKAQKVALVRENIGAVWCDDPPRPEWCQWLRRVGGKPVVKVDDTKLTIGVRAAIPGALAEELCRDVAVALFDDNAIPIGFVRIDVESGPDQFITNCFVG